MKSKNHMIEVFTEYENKFNEWLYSAWNFDFVDWDGLVEAAEESINKNKLLSDEQKRKFYGDFTEDVVY